MSLVTPQPKENLTPEQYAEALFAQPMPDWDELLRINLSAVYFSCVAFMPLLAANPHRERASIVTVGSISGTTALSQGGQYAYNVCTQSLLSNELLIPIISGLKSWATLSDQDAC
jgi:NAD(P)-dependent dehydrogenase (short-subunit alcohol dehydrogenase family)